MKIAKLNNAKFGNKSMYTKLNGFVLYKEGKGYIAFSHERDRYGILIPYMPRGGRKALQSILDQGGFINFDGMEYVNEYKAA